MKFTFMSSGSPNEIPLNFVYGVVVFLESIKYYIEYARIASRVVFARVTRPARVRKFVFQLASLFLIFSMMYWKSFVLRLMVEDWEEKVIPNQR